MIDVAPYSVTLPDGLALRLPSKSMQDVVREVWTENVYHLHRMRGGLVVDLGANVGIFTRYALHRGAAHVIAVEPDPENAELLRKNVRGLPVDILEAALWYGDEDISCIRPAGLLYPGIVHVEGVPGPPGEVFEVRALTLEELALPSGRDIDFLKIDIEGAEYNLFESCEDKSIARCRYITVETHPTTPERWGCLAARLSRTHSITTLGDAESITYIWATRYNL